jgi:hypothetical protein
MMGHASITTTSIYLHHRPRGDDADKLGKLVQVAQAVSADELKGLA